MDIERLSDDDLRERLRSLRGRERRLLGGLLRHLAEADRRRASDGWGFPSLFVYCTEELRYSEAAAYKRITAARAAARFPRLWELLEQGRTHLEAILILAPHLTPENEGELLARAQGKSKRDVEALVAEIAPRPDVRDCVMRLPAPAAAEKRATSPDTIAFGPIAVGTEVGSSSAPSLPDIPAASTVGQPAGFPGLGMSAPAPDLLEALSPGRMHFGFTGSRRLWEKLERIKGLLRLRHPRGRLEDIIGEAADVFLDAKDPERRAAGREVRRRARRERQGAGEDEARGPAQPAAARPAIPQAIRDAVRLRDCGQCTFVAQDGRRCSQRYGLEYDHIVPWALGGRSDCASNIRLLCRVHNQHAAREIFGPDLVGPHRRNLGDGGDASNP
jgi:hypothetical protein